MIYEKTIAFCIINYSIFQRTLLVEISTLVACLKSILLLKIKCFYTHIYMETDCSQTDKMQNHYMGKENAWGAGKLGERVGVN